MLIIQCWYWQEKSSICLHRNLCLGAHLRREMDTIKGKMQAKKRALERNRLDVRFEDYLVQLFSCQSDKGDALNQVTTRREKQTLLFCERWPSCLQHLVESVHQHQNSIPVPRQENFTTTYFGAPLTPTPAISAAHCHLHPANSLPPKEDTTWLYYCRQAWVNKGCIQNSILTQVIQWSLTPVYYTMNW